MKSSIPTPVIAGIIAVIVIAIGLFLWKSGTASATSDVKAVVSDINQGKPKTEDVPQDMVMKDLGVRGGKKGQSR